MKNRLIILMAVLFLAETSCIYTSAAGRVKQEASIDLKRLVAALQLGSKDIKRGDGSERALKVASEKAARPALKLAPKPAMSTARPLAAPAAGPKPPVAAPRRRSLPETPEWVAMPVGGEAKRIARGLVFGVPGVPSVACVSAESDDIKVPVGIMPQRLCDSAELIDVIREGLGLPGDTSPLYNLASNLEDLNVGTVQNMVLRGEFVYTPPVSHLHIGQSKSSGRPPRAPRAPRPVLPAPGGLQRSSAAAAESSKVIPISEEGGNCAAAMQYVFARDAAAGLK